MNLILLEADELSAEGEAVLRDARAEHVRAVLGAQAGSRLRVGVVGAGSGTAEVIAIDDLQVKLRCSIGAGIPERPPVDLLLALPRPKVLARLWPQLAAVGVGRVLLTNAVKVERYYFDSSPLDPAVYGKLLREGLAQAKDTRLPIVSIHKRLKPLVEDELDAIAGGSRRLLADPIYPRSPFDALSGTRARVLLALGPEGGWVDYERDLFERHGFAGVGLGPRTLRSDTAAVALLAVVHEALRR
ncbi:MAG: 16S rRNA (uracil(1498)-N(3))-methyltransferase [Sandaracinaceae bacterium]|nr:16S rRNA (uracil(1498)-N(3))-methyltransferase [Sandaracinaceae bacterium]